MRLEEQVKKIKNAFNMCTHKSGPQCFCAQAIAAEIREAVEEAVTWKAKELLSEPGMVAHWKDGFDKGRTECSATHEEIIRKAVEEAVNSDSTMSLFIHKRLLSEAKAEAIREWEELHHPGGPGACDYGSGLTTAYEDAAKIANKHFQVDDCPDRNCPDVIAEEIRARAAEVGK